MIARSRRFATARFAQVLALSIALTYGGASWLVSVHHGDGAHEHNHPSLVLHVLRDATLALPAVLLAVALVAFLGSRLLPSVDAQAPSRLRTAAIAIASGLAASLALGVGVPVHAWLFDVRETHDLSLAAHIGRDALLAAVVVVPISLLVLPIVRWRERVAAHRERRIGDFGKRALAGTGALLLAGAGGYQVVADVPAASELRDKTSPCFNDSPVGRPFAQSMPIPPLKQPNGGIPNRYTITEQRGETEIIPGLKTPIWGYDGIYPGPTFLVDKAEEKGGQRPISVAFHNKLPPGEDPSGLILKHPPSEKHHFRPSTTTVHLHGINGDHFSDGYTSDGDGHRHLQDPGTSYEHVYANNEYQRPATYWYHDHSVHITSPHVYRGLAGMWITQDAKERALNLPKGYGVHDIPLVLKDVMISPGGIKGANNAEPPPAGTLIYDNCSHMGAYGDVMTMNGKQQPKFDVAARKYRFRLLNGSDARQYLLAVRKVSNLDRPVDDAAANEPFTLIGSDQGLLRNPEPAKMQAPAEGTSGGETSGQAKVALDGVHISPAERLEFVMDFKRYAGQRLVVVNLLAEPRDRKLFPIMAFDVSRADVADESSVPPVLRPDLDPSTPWPDEHEADLQQPEQERTFVFDKSDGAEWVINRQTFDPLRDSGKPRINSTERWVLDNPSGGWGHPIHLHLGRFRIVKIEGRAPRPGELQGWKDVVWLGPNQRITVEHQWWNFSGRFVFHCHNGSHEDFDMMSQVEVQPAIPPPSESSEPEPGPTPIAPE